MIHELTVQGILSFPPDATPLPLRPLNVLIGPNGSGKSNLIESLGLLRSAARKLSAPFRGSAGSGVHEWIWKGSTERPAVLEAVIADSHSSRPLRHRLEFTESGSRLEVVAETITGAEPASANPLPSPFYRFENGQPLITPKGQAPRPLRREDLAPDESILSQRRDPDQYPELSRLAATYDQVRLYRDWSFGRSSIFRVPQAADLPGDRLEEDFSNLGLFLNHLRGHPQAKKGFLTHLQDLYEGIDDFDVRIKGGSVEVFLTEGDFTIPASRLSDGTLRYLCLLAILCDPDPPPLIGIEEPELGLHPDILPKLAERLIDASRRTQLIVTTHSDLLVDALNDSPQSVVVVEKHSGRTHCQRLEDGPELQAYLQEYRLGELWLRGMLGGTRW